VVDWVRRWQQKTELSTHRFIGWLGLPTSKFYDWQARYGKVNEHNGWIPRDFWLEVWEKRAILDFHRRYPLEGYRRLTFMMLDADHVDIRYINLSGTFYYLCSVLDGYSRFMVHWDLRESMTTAEVEIILQRAREKFPDTHPRVISDNGPQFIARDFKEFIRICGMTHVKTSPFYPQSNGKLERWHQSLKGECLRPGVPLSPEDARRLVSRYVDYYNTVRLHSAIGYVTPQAKLEGREPAIFAARDRKLEEARRQRQLRPQETGQKAQTTPGATTALPLN